MIKDIYIGKMPACIGAINFILSILTRDYHYLHNGNAIFFLLVSFEIISRLNICDFHEEYIQQSQCNATGFRNILGTLYIDTMHTSKATYASDASSA